MKTFSLSATLVLTILLGFVSNLLDMNERLNPTLKANMLSTSIVSPKSGGYSGSYPANSGYHSYGYYSIDASGIPNGSAVTINYQSYDVPNRFYLVDDCGLGTSAYSGSSSPYNYWVGSASYSGPWNYMGGISTTPSGNVSLTKTGGCNTYKFQVETSTGSSISDGWAVSY